MERELEFAGWAFGLMMVVIDFDERKDCGALFAAAILLVGIVDRCVRTKRE